MIGWIVATLGTVFAVTVLEAHNRRSNWIYAFYGLGEKDRWIVNM